MTRRNRRSMLLALILVIGIVPMTISASAETVLLSRGQGAYGLGWLFLQQDGTCRIATPRHVIEADNGELVPADVLDRYGRPHATFHPVAANSVDLDLAFLEVRGGLAEEGCSTSRLSPIAVKTALERMHSAVLAIATPFDRQTLPIERKATSRDAEGGLVVAIGPRPGSQALMQGMSGGTVLVDNLPVAMLLEVDTSTGTGIALRFDVIAEELSKLSPSSVPQQASRGAVTSELMLIYGEVAQRDGSISAFLAGQSHLVVEPIADRFSVVASLERPTSIDQIMVSAEGLEPRLANLIVEVAPQNGGFVPGALCTMQTDGSSSVCRFSSRLVERVRITIPTHQTIQITKLEITGVDNGRNESD
jgi:hypothetical protein